MLLGGGFRHFLACQLGWGTEPADQPSEPQLKQKQEGVYNFLQVPWNLEPMMWFGWATCLDSFIQHLTFFPLRVASAALSLLRFRGISATQSQDLLRGVLILLASYFLNHIDMSQAYHNVRNQSVIKLYVVFNVLEIFDKLLSSFGSDILESLNSSTRRKPRWRGGMSSVVSG